MALKSTHFVVAGAGYAGLSCALKVASYAKKYGQNSFKVSLINSEPRQELREELSRSLNSGRGDFLNFLPLIKKQDITFIEGSLGEIDPKNFMLLVRGQRRYSMEYSQLILAMGLKARLPSIEGLSEIIASEEEPFKKIYTLRSHVDMQSLRLSLRRMGWADNHPLKSKGDSFVVIVGAGARGLEVAGELASMRGKNAKKRVLIVDQIPELLPQVSPVGRRLFMSNLRSLQIETVLGSPVSKIESDKLHIRNGQIIPWHLLILCTGSKIQRPLLDVFGEAATDEGLQVKADFGIVGFENHYAVGALAKNKAGTPSEQGSFVGEQLGRNLIKGERKNPHFRAGVSTTLITLGPLRGLGQVGKSRGHGILSLASPFIVGPLVHQLKKVARLKYLAKLRLL